GRIHAGIITGTCPEALAPLLRLLIVVLEESRGQLQAFGHVLTEISYRSFSHQKPDQGLLIVLTDSELISLLNDANSVVTGICKCNDLGARLRCLGKLCGKIGCLQRMQGCTDHLASIALDDLGRFSLQDFAENV